MAMTMVNSDSIEHRRFSLFSGLISCLMIIAIPSIMGLWRIWPILVALVGIVVMSMIISWLLRWPKTVTIDQDGMMFDYHFFKNRKVGWGDIRGFLILEGNTSTFWGRASRMGMLCDMKWKYFYTNYEVSQEIKRQYYERFGHDPPCPKYVF